MHQPIPFAMELQHNLSYHFLTTYNHCFAQKSQSEQAEQAELQQQSPYHLLTILF